MYLVSKELFKDQLHEILIHQLLPSKEGLLVIRKYGY